MNERSLDLARSGAQASKSRIGHKGTHTLTHADHIDPKKKKKSPSFARSKAVHYNEMRRPKSCWLSVSRYNYDVNYCIDQTDMCEK